MYVGRVLADKPYGFWSLDNASPFPDLSGNANSATATGTYKYANTLVAGGGKSLLVNSAYIPSFSFPLLKTGYESRGWSWEIWFHPLQCNNLISILQHGAAKLTFDGSYLTFTMYFNDSTTANVQYEVKDREVLYVVATHTANRITLYVNGNVIESTEINDSQNLAGYSIPVPSAVVTSGNGTTDTILIDSVAFYAYDLSPSKVKTHFSFGRDVSLFGDVVNQNFGYSFEPNDADADIYYQQSWDTDADFNTSPLSDVTISDGLKPAIDSTGAPIPCSWIMPINMGALNTLTVDYVRIGWVGKGTFTVELSTDGATWNTISNDVARYLAALDVKEKIFEIRVSFDGTDANAELDYLDFVVYKSSLLRGSQVSRYVTYDGVVTVARTTNEPIEANIKRGADVSHGGAVRANIDQESSPINTKTVDVWANFDPAGQFMIMDMRSVGNTTRPYILWNGTALVYQGIDKLYVDGTLVTLASWTPNSKASRLFTIVLTTAANYSVTFGTSYNAYLSNGQVEAFAFYATEPTASDVLRMYNSYYGILTLINDSSTVAISESSTAYELYSYPWSITGAGG